MAKKPNRQVWVMPKRWILNFMAAWRTFERTLNPAFAFLFKCVNCGAVGYPLIRMVKSVSSERAFIGMECTECLNTIKFEEPVSDEDDDFPERLKKRGISVLVPPDGEAANSDFDLEDIEDIAELLFE